MINVAILGYGTVGSGVFEVLNENKESISRRAGQELHVKYVLDLRDFPGQPVEKVLVHDYEQIVSDPEVDIVVEVMGGVEPEVNAFGSDTSRRGVDIYSYPSSRTFSLGLKVDF